jgi:molecular chaperone DnaK (HSP70)
MVTTKDGMKAAYALIGAPVWAAKKINEMTADVSDVSKREFDAWVKEGEKLAKKLSDKKMVEELSGRVDLDQIQDQVEKLRDQLEAVLGNWRDSFRAEAKPAAKPAAKAPAKKPAARKPAAKKPATAAKKPAARKPAAKKPATAAKK